MIVLVFIAGLVKLWFKNRLMAKHTVLDEEKRARQKEMRMSGLPVGKRADIPFGVRAIQSGIEVDGIWISRPGTPADSGSPVSPASPLFSPSIDAKGKARAGGVRSPTATFTEVLPSPARSPQTSPDPNLVDRYHPTDSSHGAPSSAAHGPQPTYKPRQPPLRPSYPAANTAAPGRHSRVETYVPTTSNVVEPSSQRQSSVDRHSPTFDGPQSQWDPRVAPRYQTQSLGQPWRTSSDARDTETSILGTSFQERGSYFPTIEREQRKNPFDNGESDQAPTRDSHMAAQRQDQSQGAADASVMLPSRSYSGETHANTARRKVNAGFEVLPAGTFGRSDNDVDLESGLPNRNHNRHSSAANKLQKKGRDRSSSRD
jgi:hypothetical protein